MSAIAGAADVAGVEQDDGVQDQRLPGIINPEPEALDLPARSRSPCIRLGMAPATRPLSWQGTGLASRKPPAGVVTFTSPLSVCPTALASRSARTALSQVGRPVCHGASGPLK